MPMGKMQFAFAALVFFFFLSGCMQQATQPSGNESASLRILTEDFPPYNFRDESDAVAGQSTEVVHEIMARLNQSAEVELMDFSSGYSLLQAGPNVVMYSVGRTPQRESQFKWAGPIGEWELTFYARNASGDLISRFSQAGNDSEKMAVAKSARSICVVRDDARHQLLVANNFTNIEAVSEDRFCASKLASGAVDLWFGSSTSFEKIAVDANVSAAELTPVYPALTSDLYVAFSLDVPDATVYAWQGALDEMKADGSYESICLRHNSGDDGFRGFMGYFEGKTVNLTREYYLSYFTATISGEDEDYARLSELEMGVNKIYSNATDFARLKAFKESGRVSNPTLKRELDVLYLWYLGNQVSEEKLNELTRLQNEVEQEFNTYRVQMNGSNLTDNEVDAILAASIDSEELRDAWNKSKRIGPVVSDKIIQLVKKRNELARELGFSNYHEMRLLLSEQDPAAVEALLDELDNLTRGEYAQVKEEMDESLSRRYGVDKSGLSPWHYQNRFFQAAPPSVYSIDFDSYFAGKDVVKITGDYYSSMGLPIDDVINRSDLYEKPGKYQHAYAISIDKTQDVRMVANVKPNAYWMGTMLHESGHAAYFKYISQELPWTLRGVDSSNTEAIAEMFQDMAYRSEWLEAAANVSRDDAEGIRADSSRYDRAGKLVFSRWAQVMYRFEKSMYENPDQDLNALWWDLVERYQLVKKPAGRDEPDWASKIHVATSPAMYHNYMIGYIVSAQLKHKLKFGVLNETGGSAESFYGRAEVGEYLKENMFAYGEKFRWDETIAKATGENLTAKYFAEEVRAGAP